MTDIAITHRKTPIADTIREAFVRLKDWLNEDVYAGPAEYASPDWADLPTYHASAAPTPDGTGARSI